LLRRLHDSNSSNKSNNEPPSNQWRIYNKSYVYVNASINEESNHGYAINKSKSAMFCHVIT